LDDLVGRILVKKRNEYGVAFAKNPRHEKWGIPEVNALITGSTWYSFFCNQQ
jgi:hypothetical protein